MKLKTFVLAAFAAILIAAGAWFIVSPSLERQTHLEQQNELLGLLDSITAGNGGADDVETAPPLAYIAVNAEMEAPAPICYEVYEETTTDYELAPPYIPVYEVEPLPTPEPLDISAFPQGIVPLGIMSIEAINLRLPVMEGVDEPELRIAPGRVPETAAIGEIGNAVIAGHRNFTFGSMFNRLGDVELGDIVQFHGLDGRVTDFEVFEILVIFPTDQIAFVQPQDKAIITLYTCTPIREATHRLLIRAVKI
jgi:LPXTG-site transpeptidase (sortase) family protein